MLTRIGRSIIMKHECVWRSSHTQTNKMSLNSLGRVQHFHFSTIEKEIEDMLTPQPKRKTFSKLKMVKL